MSTTGTEREKQERNEEGEEDISDIDRVEGFMERESHSRRFGGRLRAFLVLVCPLALLANIGKKTGVR